MAGSFVDQAGAGALTAAIKAVEARSSAEVVVAIRESSGFYLHADLIAGVSAALLTLAFLLFSRVEFALQWFVIDPLVIGGIAGWLASRSPRLRRRLTPHSLRERWVETAAHATFFERGIHLTTGCTGILVYVSLLEGLALVIGDRGVVTQVPPERWHEATAAVRASVVGKTGGAQALAVTIEGLAELLEPYLPVAEDDVNELPDEVLL